jgi:hypothetical protein
MIKSNDSALLEGPIPGMSLTSEPGAMAWENPPMLVTVDDAVAFYSERILDADATDSVIEAIDQGVSIEEIAEYLTTSGTMNGMHTLDVKFLVFPVVKELLMYVADAEGVEYTESFATKTSNRVPRTMVKEVVKEVFEESAMPEAMSEEKPRGLMARGKATKEEVL